MRAGLGDPVMAGFVEMFDPLLRLAEASPGFIWHLRAESGHVVVPPASPDQGAGLLVNVSLWTDYASLHAFTYRSRHGAMVRQRKRWFLPTPQPSTALWWAPAGERPTAEAALTRLNYLRKYGPSPRAFSLLRQFDSSGRAVPGRHR